MIINLVMSVISFSFLSGKAYSGSVLPMQIIMPILLFIGITNVLGIQILVPLGKEKIVLYSEIGGAVVDVIINAILIPKYASTGAAIGTLIAESVVLLIQYIPLRVEITNTLKEVHYFRIIAAILIGFVLSIWIKIFSMNTFGTLAISSFLFFGAYGIFLFIRKECIIVDIFEQVVSAFSKLFFKKNRK